jgi:MFS family permease
VTDRRLIWTLALHQIIAWGTLHVAFPVFIAPMEAELGWSRAEIAGAFTAGLLTSALAAVPAGRWADRHGGRGIMALGAGLGGLLLVAWAFTADLLAFYAIWAALGVTHAMCLSDPANAVVTANSRDPRRVLAGITFVTGFCSSVFVPLGAALVEAMGWRGALLAFAALQAVPTLLAAFWLRGVRGSLSGAPASARGAPLARALRRPVFWLLVVAFCAQGFLATGLAFHILPLLAERGLPLAAALLVVALHGPCQVAGRAVLFALGARAGDSRRVGLVAFGLLPPALLVLAVAPASLPALVPFAVLYGLGSGLLFLVRAAGVADLLGREGFGQISGALSTFAQVARTVAPLALGLLWEAAAGYGPVPWLLLGVAVLGGLAFLLAAREGRSAPRGG